MMLQSCCTVCATSILSSAVCIHSALAHVELEKKLLLIGIKFRHYAKEEANQQRVTWMDFLTRKKITLKIFTSFLTGCRLDFLKVARSLLVEWTWHERLLSLAARQIYRRNFPPVALSNQKQRYESTRQSRQIKTRSREQGRQ